ncbi:MAG: PfkB family carbohydrate kinase [Actinobacteria bacterium]|nr:PfkB family carbohydrate kinase [Actinomycetota bacterium]
MSSRVWIVGPIAWDTVIYLPSMPKPGKFVQAIQTIERPGGTAANAAIALATTGTETGFVGYLGNEHLSAQLRMTLEKSELKHLSITALEGPPSHVLIFVDEKGERTILGISPDRLDQVTLKGVDLRPGDIVVFLLWREHFAQDLALAKEKRCITVVGAEALALDISADIAIGSRSDITNIEVNSELFARIPRIALTNGKDGADEYMQGSHIHQPSVATNIVDTTGAGDAFLAGYVSVIARGEKVDGEALLVGSKWSAAAIATESSIPPHWKEVEK